MTTNVAFLLVLFVLKVTLDYFSFKHSNIWFDALYIVLLSVLGICLLDSTDLKSVSAGWFSIGIAILWVVYMCLRSLGWTTRICKLMKNRKDEL